MPNVTVVDPQQLKEEREWKQLWCFNLLFYPFKYPEILMQLGYEPVAPIPCSSIFGGTRMFLPNIFEYVGYIRRKDGFFGLYRGFAPRMLGLSCGKIFSKTVTTSLDLKAADNIGRGGAVISNADLYLAFKTNLNRDVIMAFSSTVIAHPFRVISLRMMAQFIGRETVYNSTFGSIREIYKSEGIWGFFSGLMPKLLFDLGCVVLTSTTIYILRRYGIVEKRRANAASRVAHVIYGRLLYPLHLVSSCMTVRGARLEAGKLIPAYADSLECFFDLRNSNQLFRGSNNFYRTLQGNKVAFLVTLIVYSYLSNKLF